MVNAATKPAVTGLNSQQQAVFNMYRKGLNICLTGTAGSGKSFTVETIAADAAAEGKVVLKAGSTGISVVNIQGDATFHSLFGLGLGVDRRAKNKSAAADMVIEKALKNQNVKKRFSPYRYSRVLIIVDEISMLDALTLWLGFSVAYKQLKEIQWLLVGDPLQLPNISGDWFWKDIRLRNATHNILRDYDFKRIHLTEIMRQKGDTDFIDALNTMRVGEMHKLFAQRFKQEEVPTNALHLYYNNESVMRRNEEVGLQLKNKGQESHIFQAIIRSDNGNTTWVKDFLPISEEMEIVLGQRFMVRRNGNYRVLNSDKEDPTTKFVSNGSIGTVVDFLEVRDQDSGKVVDTSLLVKLDSGEEIEICPVEMEGPTSASGKPLGIFKQLPGHPSESITLYKIQGLTIPSPILIHAWQLKGGARTAITTPAAMYVASSRTVGQGLLYFDNSEGGAGLLTLRNSIVLDREAKEWVESSQ